MNAFLYNLPKRASKPRQTGLTLVMDKSLSVAQAENLLSVAEPYIDFIKLGFGTALFTLNRPSRGPRRHSGEDAL